MRATIDADTLNFYRDRFYSDANRALVEACRRGDAEYVRAHLLRQDRKHPDLWEDEILANRFGMQAIAAYLRGLPSLDVLDVACGSCQLLYELARQGHDVAGVDASTVRVETHRPRLQRLALGMAERVPFDAASFDVVIALECLEHVMDLGATMREVLRLLRPAGIFLAQVPNGAFADGLNHVRLFDAQRLTATCERAGLHVEHLLHVPYLLGESPNNLFVMASTSTNGSELGARRMDALNEIRRRGGALGATLAAGQRRPPHAAPSAA